MQWFKSEHIEESDEHLISKYKETDKVMYASDLYSKYIELVYGLCLKHFKEQEASKDAVMDIYELILKKLKTHEVTHFKSWLYILSKNHCLGKLRKEKSISERKDKYQHINGQTVFHPFTEDLKENQIIKLENCLTKLIENQRTCVKLFYLEKNSYKDIANQLSMSWARVRSLIQNGRRNLKLCIERS